MRQLLFIFVLLFFVGGFLQAAPYFAYTPQAKSAYQKALNLRFDEAKVVLQQIKQDDPENLIIHHVENYIDFFTVFINENYTQFKQLEVRKSTRLKAIQQGPKDSPYFLYTQAEIRLQWALARLKFEEYFNAFNEVSKAYKQLNQNQEKFPAFIANKKSLGILHALIGTIPDNYQWGVKILGGMEGSIENGRREIEEVLNYAKHNDFLFEEETVVMYSFLLLHLKNQDINAWNTINNSKLNPKKNPLACFALANLAMRTGRNDYAIQLLQNRPKGTTYHPFHYLDYMLGLAKLYRMDKDADVYIERYINFYRGQNYLKEAYQKLAWFYLLQGNEIAYKNNMRYCEIRGAAVIDGDKTALKEALSKKKPHPTLLQARVLFDGGYYRRAYDLLQAQSIGCFETKQLQLEYTYRLGRISHKMGYEEEALEYYQSTLDQGRNESYFYACNAALQMGIIYEQWGQNQQALDHYVICLSLKPDEYKNSLHQKAKAGKNRLKR